MCGLVTKSRYPEFLDLIRNYDIIGIQERKTDDCDYIHIPGYNIYFNNRKNLIRRKSGGIVLLVKEGLQKYVQVETRHNSNLILWCNISRDLIQTENDVYCGVVYMYIPPTGSRYTNAEPYTELQAEILQRCTKSPHIILMGDFNSRTGERDDIFHNDNFWAIPTGSTSLNMKVTKFVRNYFVTLYP